MTRRRNGKPHHSEKAANALNGRDAGAVPTQSRDWCWATDESQGLARCFFGVGSVGVALRCHRRSPAVRSVGVDRKPGGGICAVGVGRRGGRQRDGAVACWWARVTDVAKRRRQELRVCRAALPFEGLIHARSGVALAPTLFFGALACQSRTIRS
jgi:hypothetical protein